jgi:hypothetical protein
MKWNSLKAPAAIAAIVVALFGLPAVSLAGANAKVAAPPLTRDEMVDGCVKGREKDFECKEEFIDAMIALRSKHQPEIKKAVDADAAGTRAVGIKEITEDGSGELAPRKAKCEEMVDHMTAAGKSYGKAQKTELEACWTKKDCKARIACEMPLLEKMMFGGAPAGAVKPTK